SSLTVIDIVLANTDTVVFKLRERPVNLDVFALRRGASALHGSSVIALCSFAHLHIRSTLVRPSRLGLSTQLLPAAPCRSVADPIR
ncbi:MAG TPA: hypothetical protein VM513_08155, partial [Kofleriaceae bacterium]|nr:hypothetical protein [Kofleriaceae bacterium]